MRPEITFLNEVKKNKMTSLFTNGHPIINSIPTESKVKVISDSKQVTVMQKNGKKT